MRQLLVLSIGVVGICLSFAACQASKPESTTEVQKADSADLVADVPLVTLNPDTSFASIEDLVYQIDTLDTLHSGIIDSYVDLYNDPSRILAFRGNPARDGMVFELEKQPDSLYIDWTFVTKADYSATNLGSWGGGTGWTGQALYVHWPDSLAASFKSQGTMKAEAGNREVIVASLCRHVYFIDFETGEISREPIFVNHPIKGTPLLDPTLNGLLYVGHGVKADSTPWGQFVIDLNQHAVTQVYGQDHKAWRGWNGNDSSPLRIGQFVFRPSENGTLYKYLVEGNKTTLHSALRYKKKGAAGPGMEASMSVWRNYGYLNDNHGNVLCVNLNTLKPVWRYDNQDDSDSSPVVSHEGDKTYIYSGCEVDRKAAACRCRFVKLDALTGAEVWVDTTTSRQAHAIDKHFDGGYFSTPLLGHGVCEDLIFVNRVLNTKNLNGELVAFEKATGKQRFTVPLKHYAWSSPIGFMSADGKFTIFTGDTAGYVYLIDGQTGEMLYQQHVGSNFESSPIAVDDCVVLGTRGNKIFKLRLVNDK